MAEGGRSKTRTQIWVVKDGQSSSRTDQVATEEPLEIRLLNPRRPLAITMRTPGADFELVAGFLYSEGVIHQRRDILRLRYCVDPEVEGRQRYNIVTVELASTVQPDLPSLERHFYTTSACGVCGKTSLEALKLRQRPSLSPDFAVPASVICCLPEQLRSAQGIFQATGGLHAAALFDRSGQLLAVQEDVGRHNALDKLVGAALLADQLPLQESVVLVSGRASFELLQKCLMAGVAVVCAVSAPSSLAVALAQEFGITLVGFLRGERFNIYSHPHRILNSPLP